MNFEQSVSELQAVIDRELGKSGSYTVLEAGCGSRSLVRFSDKARLVGIDISEKQLERNTVLHEKIAGDIQTYPLGEEKYDAIISWDVLEHLETPQLAVDNFIRAVRKGGLIILGMPNVRALKGLVTKLTPYGFHVWYHRTIYGDKNAGINDHGPFKTYLDTFIAPDNLTRYAATKGMSVAYLRYWGQEGEAFVGNNSLMRALWGTTKAAAKVFSFGAIRTEDSEFIIALKK